MHWNALECGIQNAECRMQNEECKMWKNAVASLVCLYIKSAVESAVESEVESAAESAAESAVESAVDKLGLFPPKSRPFSFFLCK